MTRRAAAAALLACTAPLALGACADDDAGDRTAPTVPAAEAGTGAEPAGGERLPPKDARDLEPVYGELFAGHDLVLTERGGLIDRTDGYEQSASGTHLALYAAPTRERTDQEHLDALFDLTRGLATDAFDRYPDLESFDVCQEALPPDGGWGRQTPQVVTQIDLTREQVESIDWDTAQLADVLLAVRELPDGVVRVRPSIAELPGWQEAMAEVDARS